MGSLPNLESPLDMIKPTGFELVRLGLYGSPPLPPVRLSTEPISNAEEFMPQMLAGGTTLINLLIISLYLDKSFLAMFLLLNFLSDNK